MGFPAPRAIRVAALGLALLLAGVGIAQVTYSAAEPTASIGPSEALSTCPGTSEDVSHGRRSLVEVTVSGSALRTYLGTSEDVSHGRESLAAHAVSGSALSLSNCRLTFIDEVQLASERAGILADVAPVGSRIAAGEAVARLRDGLVRANLAIAEREAANDIDVRFARTAGELAQLKYERAAQANRHLAGTVSELELRELRLAADKARLQREVAQHHRAIAGLRRDEILQTMRSLQIDAPFDGLVRAVHKRPGEVVQEGEVIAEFLNTRRIRVEGYVNISQLHHVRPGQRVKVWLQLLIAAQPMNPAASNSDAKSELPLGALGSLAAQGSIGNDRRPGPEQVSHGHIRFVDVKVEPFSQKSLVWAEVDNSRGLLREGLQAIMLIESAVSVPVAANR